MAWYAADPPVAPWDTPGLPPRALAERCATHPWVGAGSGACAYRDDDPARCSVCHTTVARGCEPQSCSRERKARKLAEESATA